MVFLLTPQRILVIVSCPLMADGVQILNGKHRPRPVIQHTACKRLLKTIILEVNVEETFLHGTLQMEAVPVTHLLKKPVQEQNPYVSLEGKPLSWKWIRPTLPRNPQQVQGQPILLLPRRILLLPQ